MEVVKTLPNKASTDLSDYAGYAVKFDTTGINVCSAITDQAIGVIKVAGETQCDVVIFGDALALAGGDVTNANMITPHTDGTVIETAASSQEFALALEDGVAGDWVRVFVLGNNMTQS